MMFPERHVKIFKNGKNQAVRIPREFEPIGGNDLLIAAQALALDYTVVTDNEDEFARVTGLLWEHWLRPAGSARE